ncbi:UNKNOWN [Stylonychia lemnae]|uniref:Chromo domain-containing protein n=1 Tax=Stylonychia lemnae TaxID=5949 RepID=A0A078B430_STYLE|nr:UNKNOWN [Stylonychia lemnae]|eukprot:CDW88268.1 UNKNOWN [Stylonychia lemnae]
MITSLNNLNLSPNNQELIDCQPEDVLLDFNSQTNQNHILQEESDKLIEISQEIEAFDKQMTQQQLGVFRAMSDNFGDQTQLNEIVDITYHRTIKGQKGRQYYCVWKNHDPTWENEKLIKNQVEALITSYWLNIGKQIDAENRKYPDDLETLKKNNNVYIQQPKSMSGYELERPVKQNLIKKSVLHVTRKRLKTCSPSKFEKKFTLTTSTILLTEISPQKENILSQDNLSQQSSATMSYQDIETALLSNIGNWKKQRRLGNKDIFKCNECETLMEVERKQQEQVVRIINFNKDTIHHQWFDQNHLEPFSTKESLIKSDKIHTSVEAFIKLQMREKRGYTPQEILENLRRERPQLYKNFKPSIEQIAYFILGNTRELATKVEKFNNQRITRSKKKKSLSNRFPQSLDDIPKKKRQVKSDNKMGEYYNKVLRAIKIDDQNNQSLNIAQEKETYNVLVENPKQQIEIIENNENLQPNQQQSIVKEVKQPEKNIGHRVTFNNIVQQQIFEKVQYSDEDEKQLQSKFQQDFEDSDNCSPSKQGYSESDEKINEEDLSIYDSIDSDQEQFDNGNFLKFIKHQTLKANQERDFLMNQLKTKERRGSIFIDKVKKVITTIKRDSDQDKYDYLIEWEFNKEDLIIPSTSLVRGSLFAFCCPLQFRRFAEKKYN